jgi:hypothetical protein
MIEKDKNREIDNILNSIHGMQKATPGDEVFSRIALKITGGRIIPLRTISFAAASVLLLVVLNVIAVQRKDESKQHANKDGMQELVSYYGLTDNPYGI